MKFRLNYLGVFAIFLFSCSSDDDSTTNDTTTVDCSNVTSVFTISTSTDGCTVNIESELSTTSQYQESVSGNIRTVQINSVANHLVGTFPNSGNPNAISVQDKTFTMPVTGSQATASTNGQGWVGGVLMSGVTLEVYTAEFFIGSSGQTNNAWNRNALQSVQNLGLDCNNAHVQPTGNYHYHGIPNAYAAELGITGSEMVQVGWAADGFPVFYLYYEDDSGAIVEASASYELRSGARGGDGITAPDGCFDGEYFQDYEFVENSGDLDACNGRFGPTPNNATGEYYYVITNDFPSMPLCFSGTPDDSFRLGGM